MIEPTQPGRGRGFLSLAAAIAALTAFLMLAPSASAVSDPLASGTTTIKLGKAFTNKLSKSGVKLLGAAPGTAKGGSIVLPVLSGSIDPVAGQGIVAHAGGFKFKRGRKSAAVQELSLETATGSLVAKVGGKKMKFASAEGFGVGRDGFGINLSVANLKLFPGAAKALNKKLSLPVKKAKGAKAKAKGKASASKGATPPFKANMGIGSSLSDTEPATVNVQPTGIIQLLARPQDRPPYETAEVKPVMYEPGVFGPTIEEIPALHFPLRGGTIAPDGSSGVIRTAGGIIFGQEPEGGLELGVKFAEWSVEFGARTTSADVFVESNNQEKKPTPGKVIGGGLVAGINMSGAVITPDPAARTIAVSGLLTEMTPQIAALMNTTYEKGDAFTAGNSLGTYSFTLQTE
jgi:hypothetical protein